MPHLTLARRVSWFQRRYEKQLTGHAPPRDGSFDDASFSRQRRKLGCDRGVVLQKTPFVFGVSEWELFWPLTVGSRVEINQCVGCTPSSRRRVGQVERDPTQVGSCLMPPPGVERGPVGAARRAVEVLCVCGIFRPRARRGARGQ